MNLITRLYSLFGEESKIKKNTLQEYKIAISLMEYHTNLLWLELGAFLLAETIFLGILGQMLTKNHIPIILVIAISAFGLILCIPWYSTFEHNYRYYQLRVAQARGLEPQLGFSLLLKGNDLSVGNIVQIDNEKIQFGCFPRILPPRRAIPLLILFFVFIFILTIVSSIFKWI